MYNSIRHLIRIALRWRKFRLMRARYISRYEYIISCHFGANHEI